jgi:hypothetical protein
LIVRATDAPFVQEKIMLSRPLLAKITIVFALLMTVVYLTSPTAAFLAGEETTPAETPAETPVETPTPAKVKVMEPIGVQADKTINPASGRWVTSEDTITVRFSVITDHPGKLSVLVNGTPLGTAEPINGSPQQKDISVRLVPGSNRISARWDPDSSTEQGPFSVDAPEWITIVQDKTGPIVNHVEIVGTAETGFSLLVRFNDSDLKQTSIKAAAFAVNPLTAEGGVDTGTNKTTNAHYVNPSTVQIVLGMLEPRRYQLTVHGTSGGGREVVTDLVANPAGNATAQTRIFQPIPTPQTGPRVEFPEFLPTARQPDTERRANPGDRVETRVARLYYYRDAHRVAQIINRITQSYNRAAVTQAQRRAEDARLNAESVTDERRARERAAVEAAQATRRIEQQLQAVHQELQRLRLVEIAVSKIDDLKGTVNTGQMKDAFVSGATVVGARIKSPGEGGPVDPVAVQGEITGGRILAGSVQGVITNATFNGTSAEGFVKSSSARNGSISAGFASGKIAGVRENNEVVGTFEGDISAATIAGVQMENVVLTPSSGEDTTDIKGRIERLTRQIPDLQQAINAHRTVELAVAEESQQLQAREDRAIAEQFRQQVAAAHEDPDTHAPATLNSVDPVAQVSISVIGEGLLHLRGPIRGINTVRRMIHQIDAPVGQVRVQIHTVQINGERGDQMEQVAGRVEGYVDLGRFLTNQSLLLLRRAVVQEAAQVAQMAGLEGHYQVDRDRRYLYAFFGRDFIDEMYEMDSEFLRSENKLLSLHSMDTISLNQALFIMALARNDVRERIVQRFMHLVQSELPQAEWDFRRSSELYPHKTRMHLPFTNRTRIEQNTMERVFLNAQQRYHFRNVRSFFENDTNWCGAGMDLASFEGSGYTDPNTMNSMQRTFLRLAQIFKSQMIAEVELKQRVIERAMIEDEREDSFRQEDRERVQLREIALRKRREQYEQQVLAAEGLLKANTTLQTTLADIRRKLAELRQLLASGKKFALAYGDIVDELLEDEKTDDVKPHVEKLLNIVSEISRLFSEINEYFPTSAVLDESDNNTIEAVKNALKEARNKLERGEVKEAWNSITDIDRLWEIDEKREVDRVVTAYNRSIEDSFQRFASAATPAHFNWNEVVPAYGTLDDLLRKNEASQKYSQLRTEVKKRIRVREDIRDLSRSDAILGVPRTADESPSESEETA